MVDVAGQAVVAVLTRAPSAGGKSRLFAALGRPPDPALLSALLLDTLEPLSALPGAACVVCFTPDDAAAEMRGLVPPGVRLRAQGDGGLGARMHRVLAGLLGAGARTVVLVGSDLPLIDPQAVLDAQAHLLVDPGSVVLGPAADGGYYLFGAARIHDGLFEEMAWGTPGVLAATLARAEAAGIRVHLVAAAADVDTPDDLRHVAAAGHPRAPRTRDWVARWL